MRSAQRRALFLASVSLSLATLAQAQLLTIEMVPVPAEDSQPGGPEYSYEVGRFEVTNAQYVEFLNDAEFHNEQQNPGFGDERGANLAFRQPPFGGDVGLVIGAGGAADAVFDISRSLLLYDDDAPVGHRFGVTPGKANDPVVGLSWIGAVKFCNWLTIDQGFGLAQRCYSEGASEFDWFPLTIGDEVGGTQQATNAIRDLTSAERLEWVREYRGFRLLMDQGGTSVGAVNAVPRPFNEWYKAAAYDPGAPDSPRLMFPGFPFEEHIVPPDHWAHSYGRDPLTGADANYRDSGDPFDDPDPAVIATTPVGYYDGTDHSGVFATSANDNRYDIFDMSGNVWELLNDQVTITDSVTPDRALAGGGYRSNVRQVSSANRGDIGPGTTRPVVGFRVVRVPAAPCLPSTDTPTLLLEKRDPDLEIRWAPLPDASTYDLVRGELGLLLASNGDFEIATLECIADDTTDTAVTFDGDPPGGDAYWFLARAANCGGGPYESGSATQAASRDTEIELSVGACLSSPTFDVSLLARTGDEPPGRPGHQFSTFSDPELNDSGQVVFKGNFGGASSSDEGIYRWNPALETLERIVDDSFDFSPPGQGGTASWSSFGPPVMNESGHVLFHGTFSFGDNSQGLYVFTGSTEASIFDDSPSQPVPGQPEAQGFSTFPFSAGVLPVLSDDHFAPAVARYWDADLVERQGLYLGDSQSGIVRVADFTLSPPDRPLELFTAFDFFTSTNPVGDVALHAQFTGGGHGVYRYVRASNTLLRIADNGMTPPGQFDPAKFSVIDSFPSMNAAGVVAFRASYSNGVGNSGIYRGDGVGPLELIVDELGALPIPGHPGATFSAFGLPALNASGDVMFSAIFTGGAGVFRISDGALSTILDLSEPVPEQPGAEFVSAGNLSVTAQGHVAFTARYSGGVGDEGLYFHDGTILRRVIDESDTSLGLTITGLQMLVVSGSSGGSDGKPNALNLHDTVTFRARLTGGHEAVLVGHPNPE